MIIRSICSFAPSALLCKSKEKCYTCYPGGRISQYQSPRSWNAPIICQTRADVQCIRSDTPLIRLRKTRGAESEIQRDEGNWKVGFRKLRDRGGYLRRIIKSVGRVQQSGEYSMKIGIVTSRKLRLPGDDICGFYFTVSCKKNGLWTKRENFHFFGYPGITCCLKTDSS